MTAPTRGIDQHGYVGAVDNVEAAGVAGYRCIPEPGQVLVLDAAACPAVGGREIRLRMTRPVRAWEADGATVHDPRRAAWWLVTGWQLGRNDEQVALRMLPVRAGAVRVEAHHPA
jgi:hypothetical protein